MNRQKYDFNEAIDFIESDLNENDFDIDKKEITQVLKIWHEIAQGSLCTWMQKLNSVELINKKSSSATWVIREIMISEYSYLEKIGCKL